MRSASRKFAKQIFFKNKERGVIANVKGFYVDSFLLSPGQDDRKKTKFRKRYGENFPTSANLGRTLLRQLENRFKKKWEREWRRKKKGEAIFTLVTLSASPFSSFV